MIPRRLARAIGTNRRLREGLRLRLLNQLRPWQKETEERFSVDFYGNVYEGQFNDVQDYLVYYAGGYENPELRLLEALGREIDNCVGMDVGTSRGQHLLVLASVCQRVYGFEPFSKVRAVANQRLASNGLRHVDLLPFGLAREDSELIYYWDERNTNTMAGSFVEEHAHFRPHAVLQVRNADCWAREAGVDRVDLIKIDVEGFEPDVLLGARNLLGSRPYILMEISYTGYDRMAEAGGLAAILPFDFDLYGIGPTKRAIFFAAGDYRLSPIASLQRPENNGYNVLVVPRDRPMLKAIEDGQ